MLATSNRWALVVVLDLACDDDVMGGGAAIEVAESTIPVAVLDGVVVVSCSSEMCLSL